METISTAVVHTRIQDRPLTQRRFSKPFQFRVLNIYPREDFKKRVKLVTLSLMVGWVGAQNHISDRKEIVT